MQQLLDLKRINNMTNLGQMNLPYLRIYTSKIIMYVKELNHPPYSQFFSF